MDDYDHFFGCERVALTADEYVSEYLLSLEISDEYISAEEPFRSYREAGPIAMTELLEISKLLARSQPAQRENCESGSD